MAFSPSIFKAFPFRMEKISLAYRIRCAIEYFVGYRIFYIRKDGEWVGYCIISDGRNPRYPFSDSSDIIYGRYYISPDYIGNGIATRMLTDILDDCPLEYRTAYAYVHKGNIASCEVQNKIGAQKIASFNKVGYFRRIVMNAEGSYTLYARDRSRMIEK